MSEEKKQNDLTLVQNELKVNKAQYNKFSEFWYRSCEDIQEAVKPLLLKYSCKLTVSDSIEVHAGKVYTVAIATFIDSAGDVTVNKSYARESETKKGMSSEQISGAASSYARKYCLGGLFLLDDQKDADSMDNKEKPQEQKTGDGKQTQKTFPMCPAQYLNVEYIEKNWNGKLYSGNTVFFDNKQYMVNDEWAKWLTAHKKFQK